MFWVIRILSIVAAFAVAFGIDRFAQSMGGLVPREIFLASMYVTLAVSLNLINGITGQFSMGHAAFYMIGAYTSAGLLGKFAAINSLPGPVQMIVMALCGAFFAALGGLVVGLPSLRLKGDYLAVVTLGFGEILRIVVQNNESLGGAYGMNLPQNKYLWLAVLLAILCIAVCRNLLRTANGLPFLAVREDEVAAGAMGVNVTIVKVIAFLVGSAFAGAAGALYGSFEGFVTPATFKMDVSFMILTMVVLGGTGSITGSAIAAVVLFYLPEKLRDLPPVAGGQLVASAIAILFMVVAIRKIGEKFHGSKAAKSGLVVGTMVATIVIALALGPVMGYFNVMKGKSFQADVLRMVLFSTTLIVMMLLRPQGIFAHHEFSWDWLKGIFGKKKTPTSAVNA